MERHPTTRIGLPVICVNTAVVGSGAASLNCAVQLDRHGCHDIVILTDDLGGGASKNTGSDKQTYYKLSLCGGQPDSPREMAASLCQGGAMHGDIALVEATLSAQSFFHLVSLGVPFPHDRYGGFVGYKTDHDPRQRATSAGPKTSMLMADALLCEVRRRKIAILDGCVVIGLLTAGDGDERVCVGLVCLDRGRLNGPHHGLFLVNSTNVVYGTGGPAILYRDSVYPEQQTGMSGIAYEAGAVGQNLTEWQYGLASTRFRWNVSGTYQQVIPRYISTDADGGDECEFLNPFFDSMQSLATSIFLKGYQWPFDPRKVVGGSSLIDILVFRETRRGRRVFLDFRRNASPAGNPMLQPFDLETIGDEAHRYLAASGALLRTPIERLRAMNPDAVALYAEHGIDLTAEPLEIAVCAQHNNGGLTGGIWWESNLRHFFPVGEANGSHGVYRPGGSALNSGQCGGLRAAQFISRRYASAPPPLDGFLASVSEQAAAHQTRIAALFAEGGTRQQLERYRDELQARMSQDAGHVRDAARLARALAEAQEQLGRWAKCGVSDASDLPDALRNRDAAITQVVYLSAMVEYARRGGTSRGSYLVTDSRGMLPCDGLEDDFRFALADDPLKGLVCEVRYRDAGQVECTWVPCRPIPPDDGWFETVWAAYRDDAVIR